MCAGGRVTLSEPCLQNKRRLASSRACMLRECRCGYGKTSSRIISRSCSDLSCMAFKSASCFRLSSSRCCSCMLLSSATCCSYRCHRQHLDCAPPSPPPTPVLTTRSIPNSPAHHTTPTTDLKLQDEARQYSSAFKNLFVPVTLDLILHK